MESQHAALVIRTLGPSPAQWEHYRPVITALYRDKKLDEVMHIMHEQHHFRASVKMYKSRLGAWGIYKYNRKHNSQNCRPATVFQKCGNSTNTIRVQLSAKSVPRDFISENDHKLERFFLNVVKYQKYYFGFQSSPFNTNGSSATIKSAVQLHDLFRMLALRAANKIRDWSGLDSSCSLVKEVPVDHPQLCFTAILAVIDSSSSIDNVPLIVQDIVRYCHLMADVVLGSFHPLSSLLPTLNDTYLLRHTPQMGLRLRCGVAEKESKGHTAEAICNQTALVSRFINQRDFDNDRWLCRQILQHERAIGREDFFLHGQTRYYLTVVLYEQGFVDKAEAMWLEFSKNCKEREKALAFLSAHRLDALYYERLDYDKSEHFSKMALRLFLERFGVGDLEFFDLVEYLRATLEQQGKHNESAHLRQEYWFFYDSEWQDLGEGRVGQETNVEVEQVFEIASGSSIGNHEEVMFTPTFTQEQADSRATMISRDIRQSDFRHDRPTNPESMLSRHCEELVEETEDTASDSKSNHDRSSHATLMSDIGATHGEGRTAQAQDCEKGKGNEVERAPKLCPDIVDAVWMDEYFDFDG